VGILPASGHPCIFCAIGYTFNMKYLMTWGIFFKFSKLLPILATQYSFNYRVVCQPRNLVEFILVDADNGVEEAIENYVCEHLA
jgi:hypothetical protein